MFLKSLTLRGFKSFAEKTVLVFEPGVTVIVGPNGSGKSNVVDAIAWVLGEQGPKALRGGRMEDVIFGGTGDRPPLGRAEVTLTIDNGAGLLPIAYAEVTISRLLYRSGDSEYAINGTACRLLDVQELLSDTGVGRELHTIIGQGNLDDVLHGRPEDRRAAIEEAAGIAKHRRRKDRALRKLSGVEQQLVRLTDLVGELRRQLKPLQQQAESARRAAEIQAELREVRLVLRTRELAAARNAARAADAELAVHQHRLADLDQAHATAQAAEAAAGQALGAAEPLAARAGETVHRLVTVRERLSGTLALAEERARGLSQPLADADEGRSPDDLLREADGVAAELAAVVAELEPLQAAAAEAEAARAAARARLAEFDTAAAASEQARKSALERTLARQGEAAARRQALERGEQEHARLAERAEQLGAVLSDGQGRLAELEAEVAAIESGETTLVGRQAEVDKVRDRLATELAAGLTEQRALEAQLAAARARREVHEAAVRATGGEIVAALEAGRPPGLIGPLAPALTVDAGYEAAVAAALGPDADAVLMAGADDATAALGHLRDVDAGRATLLFPGGAEPAATDAGLPLLSARVRADGPARAAVERLLARVLVADDLDAARALLAANPDRRVVTVAGELLAAGRIEGGAAPASGALAARRSALEATDEQKRLELALAKVSGEAEAARTRLVAADADVAEAAEALNASDAAISAVTDRLAKAGEEHRLAERELTAVTGRQAQLRSERAGDERRLAEIDAELREPRAEDAPSGQAVDRDALAAALEHAAEHAVQARVVLSTVTERHRLLEQREAGLREQASAAVEAEARRAEARAARREGARRAREAAGLASRVLGRLEQSLAAAATERDLLLATVTRARGELGAASERRRAAAAELEGLRERAREVDAAHLEARMRDDDLARRLVEELGADPDQALAEYLVADGAELAPGDPRGLPDVELRRSAAVLERRLTLIGRVNPLALEDFKALEERHAFLAGQLADLKDSRRDLLKVVRAVDERVREVFGQAFADVAREFERTFALLFPGGAGQLVLTEPDDLLASGVEVEARPPGKRLRRLSLLSGGERSLVALAFCFAIFRARPSPFYVLDEVEAALDDVNLQRFLTLLDDFRGEAQLLVVSHQRRTMEAADALYGVSMQSGGLSKVVSQRLRGRPAGAEPAVIDLEPDGALDGELDGGPATGALAEHQ